MTLFSPISKWSKSTPWLIIAVVLLSIFLTFAKGSEVTINKFEFEISFSSKFLTRDSFSPGHNENSSTQ